MLRLCAGSALMLLFCVSPLPADEVWTPEAMLLKRSISATAISPDGAWVAFSVASAVTEEQKSETLTHIWISATDGSHSYQLTRGDKSCGSPAWSPDGTWIGFTSAREAGNNNLWIISPFGGEARRLTDVKSGIGTWRWNADGTQIAFLMSDPEPEAREKARKQKNDANVVDEHYSFVHLYVIDVEPQTRKYAEPRRVTEGAFSIDSFDWSPDGSTFVFAHQRTPKIDDWPTCDISLVPATGGEVRALVTGPGQDSDPLFSPDGKTIAFASERGANAWAFYRRVCLIPTAGGPVRELPDTFDGQPGLDRWAPDGSGLYFFESRGTSVYWQFLPIDGGPARAVIDLPGLWNDVAYSRGSTVALTYEDLKRAEEVYVVSLGAPGDITGEPKQVSAVNAHLPTLPMARAEEIRWKSRDGREIEGLLYYPLNHVEGKRYPLLLNIHGGPTGVFNRTFSASANAYPLEAFTARGFFILRPNPRGSSGYGKEFRFANYNDWAGMDYEDLMTGVDLLIAKGMADEKRLGVMGWSYGGYMTSMIITKTNRFTAAAVGAGVTNLISFTGTADIPSFIPDYFGGEMWERDAVYRAHSAMFNIASAVTPTLILHGENDQRVPLGQGYELYTALKRKGVEVQMVTYPRQPHGVREPKLLLDLMYRHLNWFTEKLGGGK